MGCVMIKPGNRAAYQRICFCYIDSTIPATFLIHYFKFLTIICGYTAQFVLDMVGNPEDRFSDDAAHTYFNQLFKNK